MTGDASFNLLSGQVQANALGYLGCAYFHRSQANLKSKTAAEAQAVRSFNAALKLNPQWSPPPGLPEVVVLFLPLKKK